MTWVLISKNWAHTHNFQTLAELVSECGGKELQTHLLTFSKNASYMSQGYLQKYIKIMDYYLMIIRTEKPLPVGVFLTYFH